MKITRASTSMLAMFTLTLAPAIAQAQFSVYTNLADYLAAVSTPATDTFDDLAVDAFSAFPLARSTSGYSYRVGAPLGTYVVGTANDAWISTNEQTDILTFDDFSAGVAGVGGFFFGTDLDGTVLPGTELVLTATNDNGTSVVTVLSNSTSTFRGFVAMNGNVTSLRVVAREAFPTVNNLVLGRSPAAVPEPATSVMLVAGALGLALTARRRRTA